MAIEIRPSGEAQAVAQAGRAIGKAKAAETQREDIRRQEEMAYNEQAKKQAMDWELQKMQMNSQQDFQQELAAKQWDYEKFNRAKAWEIEKAETASRLDFEREEKARTDKYNQFTNTQNYINELEQSGNYNSQQIQKMKVQAALPYQKEGFNEVAEILGTAAEEGKFGVRPGFYEYLEPEQQELAAEIQAGIVARARPNTPVEQRKQLEAFVGPGVSEFMSMGELEDEVRKLGLDPEVIKRGDLNKPDDMPELPQITTNAEYDALPSGTEFEDPNGKIRRKP